MLLDTRKLADEDFIFTSFIGLSRHRNFEAAAAGGLRGFYYSRSHQNQCFRLCLFNWWPSPTSCYCGFFLHVKNCPNCASFDCFLKYKNLPKIWPLQNSQSWQHWSGSRQQKWLMKPNVRPSAAVDAVCNINLANLLHLFFRWCKNCVNKGKLAKVFGFDRLLLHFCLIIKYYLFFSLIAWFVIEWIRGRSGRRYSIRPWPISQHQWFA